MVHLMVMTLSVKGKISEMVDTCMVMGGGQWATFCDTSWVLSICVWKIYHIESLILIYAINFCGVAQQHLGGVIGVLLPLLSFCGCNPHSRGVWGVRLPPSIAHPGLWVVRCASDCFGIYIKVLLNLSVKYNKVKDVDLPY